MLKILQYPDPRLRRKAVLVESFDEALHQIIDSMFALHYATPNCAALAATQLDLAVPYSITVIDYSEEKNQPLCLVNPRVVESRGGQYEIEGCMSVYPDIIHQKVKRAEWVKVEACDRFGKRIQMEADGFLAKCLQHEIDHLNGMIFIDHLPLIKREKVIRTIKKHVRS